MHSFFDITFLFLIAIYLFMVYMTVRFCIRKKPLANPWMTFVLSLILTPIAGIIYMNSKRPEFTYAVKRYKCTRCGFKYDNELKYCPSCEREGEQVELIEVTQVMT